MDMKKIVISIILLSFLIAGCKKSDIKVIPEYVNLSIPGDLPGLIDGDTSSSISYRTFGWFDLQKLEGVGRATNKPFVYVRKLNHKIIVRPSDDISNPYILTDHGRYWHCSWKGDGRGDSIKIDRFVINKNVYEYIQKKDPEGGVAKTLISTNTFDPTFSDYANVVEKNISLGTSPEFDQHPEDHFLEILDQAEQIFASDNRTETSDSLQGRCRSSRFSLRIIPKTKRSPSPIYIETRSGKEYHYDSAPLGLYDEHKDINRPYFLRRIK